MRIAAAVVLYNPDQRVANNISSYLPLVEKLYIVDNSESASNAPEYFPQQHNVKYIRNNRNLGIAAALNTAASEALSESFDFLLTMDQDSSFKEDQLMKLLNVLDEVTSRELGILSPVHNEAESGIFTTGAKTMNVAFTMTSGNLLNLRAFQEVGSFDASLFIDHVDHEYCFRLITRGFKILVTREVALNHELGRNKQARLFGIWSFTFVSHSPVRTYYMIRNGLVVASRYRKEFPSFYWQNLRLMFKEIGKIPLESEKGKRIRLMWMAVKHFLSSKTGKLDY